MSNDNNSNNRAVAVRQETGPLTLQTFEDLTRLARIFHESGMFPDIKSQAQAVVKILAGQELGIPPMESMMGYDVVQGRPRMNANLMAKIIKRDAERGGYDFRIVRITNDLCEIRFFHRSEPLEPTSLFTIQDAGKANLAVKETYRFYPRNMLFARALSNGAKWHCPHLFGSGAALGEPDAEVDEDGNIIPTGPRMPSEQEVIAEANRNTTILQVPRAATKRFHVARAYEPDPTPASEPVSETEDLAPTEAAETPEGAAETEPETGDPEGPALDADMPDGVQATMIAFLDDLGKMAPAMWDPKAKASNWAGTKTRLKRLAGLEPESALALLRAIEDTGTGQHSGVDVETTIDCRVIALLNMADTARLKALAEVALWWRLNREG